MLITHSDYAIVRSTIEYLPMAIAIFDREARFLACNQQFVTECDVKFDPIGRHFHEVFPETGDHWTNIIQRGFAGELLSAEYDPFVWSDGTVSVIRWEVKPWRPIDDEIVGVIAVVKVLSDDAEIAAAREQLEEKFRNEHIHYRQIEQRHQNILELSNEIMFVCSFSGQVFECNSAMHQLFGVDVLNTPVDQLMEHVHPQDRQSLFEVLRTRIEARQTDAHIQIRCLCSGGNYHWLDWRFSILLESQLILGVARDITDEKAQQEEQKRMLLALEQSEQRLLQAERIAGIGYWESNLDGSDPHFSEGVYSIYGIPFDYPLTSLQVLWAFTYDNRYGSCISRVRNAIKTGNPFEFEYAIRRPDGEVRTLYGRGEPTYDKTGAMVKLQGIIQDITDQRRAADMLRKHEQQLAEAQHIARVGSWHWDIKQNVVTWSKEMYNLLGFVEGEIEPSYEAFFERVPFDDKSIVSANIEAVLRDKEPMQYRHRVELPSGESRTLHVRQRPHVGKNGEVVILEGTSQDITEMLEVEQMLAQQAKDLARSNRDLAQFAYVASHDLREPLRKVKSFTELLAQRYGDQLDERGREWMQHIIKDTARMQSLIQDVLAYSQLNQDRKLQEATDLNRIFEQACTALYSRIQASQAQVSADPLPIVSANPTQMSQLFQNLLDNAIKYHTIGTPIVYVSAHRNGDFWRIEVTDNGIGIDRSHRTKIFEMFGRVHGRSKHPGNGMGLAICKKIVEGHGGQIGVESGIGAGSTFWFTLPALVEGGLSGHAPTGSWSSVQEARA